MKAGGSLLAGQLYGGSLREERRHPFALHPTHHHPRHDPRGGTGRRTTTADDHQVQMYAATARFFCARHVHSGSRRLRCHQHSRPFTLRRSHRQPHAHHQTDRGGDAATEPSALRAPRCGRRAPGGRRPMSAWPPAPPAGAAAPLGPLQPRRAPHGRRPRIGRLGGAAVSGAANRNCKKHVHRRRRRDRLSPAEATAAAAAAADWAVLAASDAVQLPAWGQRRPRQPPPLPSARRTGEKAATCRHHERQQLPSYRNRKVPRNSPRPLEFTPGLIYIVNKSTASAPTFIASSAAVALRPRRSDVRPTAAVGGGKGRTTPRARATVATAAVATATRRRCSARTAGLRWPGSYRSRLGGGTPPPRQWGSCGRNNGGGSCGSRWGVGNGCPSLTVPAAGRTCPSAPPALPAWARASAARRRRARLRALLMFCAVRRGVVGGSRSVHSSLWGAGRPRLDGKPSSGGVGVLGRPAASRSPPGMPWTRAPAPVRPAAGANQRTAVAAAVGVRAACDGHPQAAGRRLRCSADAHCRSGATLCGRR